MVDQVRLLGVLAILGALSACQVTGPAPPSSLQKTGINSMGAPGSGAP